MKHCDIAWLLCTGLGIAKHCSALKNTFKMVPNRRRQDVQHGAAVENIEDGPAAGVVVNGCVVEQVDLTSRVNTASLKQSNHKISEKILPGGPWKKVLGRFKMQTLTICECEPQHTTGKCQRRFFQGVPGGRFQESSESKRTYPLAVLPEIVVSAMVTVPSET